MYEGPSTDGPNNNQKTNLQRHGDPPVLLDSVALGRLVAMVPVPGHGSGLPGGPAAAAEAPEQGGVSALVLLVGVAGHGEEPAQRELRVSVCRAVGGRWRVMPGTRTHSGVSRAHRRDETHAQHNTDTHTRNSRPSGNTALSTCSPAPIQPPPLLVGGASP